MLIPVVLFVLALMLASARIKGPTWAMSIAWLVSLVPIASGAVSYRYLIDANYLYSMTLILFIGTVAAGTGFYELVRRRSLAAGAAPVPRPTEADFARSYRQVLPVAQFCWWIAMAGTALIYIDFTVHGGAGLDDLAALRDQYTSKTSASIFAQIGSLLTWSCLFCYMFALFFRKELSRVQFVRFLLPIIGFFLLSVFSAGRQAAFQIMLVTILLVYVIRVVRGPGERRVRRTLLTRERIGLVAVSAAMIGYMGYVAVARNDGLISFDKSKVLQGVFEFRFAEPVDRTLQGMSEGLRGSIVEGVVYFSSSPALFENFLKIDWPKTYFGALTFPFPFRQVQSLTGLSPASGLVEKADAIMATGQIGSGWATAMSSYLIDFGFGGTLVFLFATGFYSGYVWRKALAFASFYHVIIAVLVLLQAIYMPLIPGISDTNIFLLWMFCLFMYHRTYRHLLPLRQTRPIAAE